MNDHSSNRNDRPADNNSTAQAATLIEPNYEALGLWLDAELEKLVARWVHLAAPNASRPWRNRR